MSVRGEIEALVKAKADQASINNATQALMKLKSGLTKMLGAIGIGISLVQLNAIAEEFNGINDQINHAVGNAENMKEVQRGILDAANNCRTSYAQMASSVVALKQANSDVFPIEDATKFVETLTKVGKVAGYSDGQISAMSNVMQRVAISGTMGANDLLRAARQAPELLDTIAKGLGVERKELDKMAEAGKLTAETIKTAVLNAESDIQNSFDQLDYSISDGLLHIRNRWGYWVDDMNSTFHISETIAKVMVTAFEKIMTILEKGKTKLEDFAKAIGGTENLLKLLAIVGGAVFLALNWDKIIKGAESFFKLFTPGNLKILAVIAALILLGLVIEDIIGFMNGKDSVIGDIFESMGISAEEGREMILNAWNTVVGFLTGVWDTLKTAAGMFVDTIMDLVDKHGEQIWADFQRYWGLVSEFVSGIWTFISELAKTLFGDVEDSVGGSTGAAGTFLSVWKNALESWSAILSAVIDAASAIFNLLADLVEFVFGGIRDFWKEWGTTILAAFKNIWEGLGEMLMAFLNIVKEVANFISAVFKGDWEAAWEAIKNILKSCLDFIKGYLKAVLSALMAVLQIWLTTIEDLWDSAWELILSVFTAIWDAIVEFFSGAWESLKSAVSNGMDTINNTIDSILNAILGIFQSIFSSIVSAVTGKMSEVSSAIINGFNEAVSFITGLIGQAYSWGADLVGNIAQGISDNISRVTDVASSVANTISGYLHFSVPDVGPLHSMETWMPDMMQNLAKGIRNNRFLVKDAVGRVATDLNVIANARMVSGATAGGITNAISNSRSVNQNVEITNQFYGDRAIQQKASNAMNRSAQDVTSQLARGLAFAK